jgi:hypothetical protein
VRVGDRPADPYHLGVAALPASAGTPPARLWVDDLQQAVVGRGRVGQQGEDPLPLIQRYGHSRVAFGLRGDPEPVDAGRVEDGDHPVEVLPAYPRG